MHIGELLSRIAERGVSLRCSHTQDHLHYAPAGILPPEPSAELMEHEQEIIRSLEDEELRWAGRSGRSASSAVRPAVTSGRVGRV